jgi:hypothetical protein
VEQKWSTVVHQADVEGIELRRTAPSQAADSLFSQVNAMH